MFEENLFGQGEAKSTKAAPEGTQDVHKVTQELSVEGHDVAVEKPQEVSGETQSKPKKKNLKIRSFSVKIKSQG